MHDLRPDPEQPEDRTQYELTVVRRPLYAPADDEEDYTYEPVADPQREIAALRAQVAELQAEIARLNDDLRIVARPGALPQQPQQHEAPGIPAARIMRRPGGKIDAVHCLLVYSKPVPVAEAIARVQANKTAFVRRVDVHQVLDAFGVVEGA